MVTRGLVGADWLPDHRILAALESCRMLVRTPDGFEAVHRTTDKASQWALEMDDRAGIPPALVFTTGSLDLIDIGAAIGVSDFELPAALLDDATTPPACAQGL